MKTAVKKRVAVLVSGSGSNLQALIDASQEPDYPAEIVCVLSDKVDAFGLKRAQQAGILAIALPRENFKGKPAFEAAIQSTLEDAGVELICLAGFMRLLSAEFTELWRDKIINIHPSLLPAFPGLDTHKRAIETGCRFAGCTVHIVRAEMDSGPILIQAAVPILEDDTPDDLAGRILVQEHKVYANALRWLCEGIVRVEGERAVYLGSDEGAEQVSFIWPSIKAGL